MEGERAGTHPRSAINDPHCKHSNNLGAMWSNASRINASRKYFFHFLFAYNFLEG